jgi:Carboxypeptidase regulatory-like domain/TonB dependent receptor
MIRSTSSTLRTVSLVACVLFFAALAQAQYRASIRGTVTDEQGAVIAGATVTLVNTATNAKLVSTSDGNGLYQFNALPPAPYRLTVEHDGFTKKVLDHVEIIPEQLNALDLQLAVGQVSQTVTVTDTQQLLDTQTATVSGTITANQIDHMPSFGRDVFQLIQLAPGVFGDGAQGSGGGGQNLPGTQGPGATGGSNGIFQTENGPQAVAHGGQYENNGITVDGISTTSAVWGGTTIITPSEDSVQSVKVVSNGYDAENGRFSGAQVQVTSKSGSNQVHGDLFFTAHRPGLGAYQRFNGPNPVQRDDSFYDQFGGNISGPIWKNKVFAFFNYETVRSPAEQTNHNFGWYDTPAFDSSAPAGSIAATYLNFPGAGVVGSIASQGNDCGSAGLTEGLNCVTIPGQGIDIGSPLTNGLGQQDPNWVSPTNAGLGNGFDGVADLANYATISNTHFTRGQYNGRLDADVTQKDRLSFAIYWVPVSEDSLNGPARNYNLFHHTQINEAYSLIWNHTFSPSFLNEARFNGAGWHWNEIKSNPQSPIGLPTDSIGEIGNITPESFGPNVGSILDQWTYSYKDVATKIIGGHTIKFGGDLTRLFYLNLCTGCGIPSYSFFNTWDFLNDAPHSESSGFNPQTGAPTTQRQDDRTNIWGFFVQDDYKLRRNLTLNLGLRWSYFGPLSSKENNMFVATPGVGANFLTGLTVHRGNSWNAQKNNFGPQLGFAWSPERFHDKLVVRGGYGLNYNQEEIAISANINANPGLIVFPTFSMSTPASPNPGIIYATSSDPHDLNGFPVNPNAVLAFGSNGLPTTGQVGVGIFPPNLPTMRTHHYSLDTQYDLGHNWIVSLGYQGSLSRDIYFHQNPNATPAALGYALNPQIGGGDYWAVNGSGNYNALLAEAKHNFSRQFMADVQFSWSKSMDTSSAPYSEQDYPYNPGINYGPSDYNVGKAFKIYGMWEPVFFHGNKAWAEKIAGGWTVTGILNWHSGFPWNPVVSVNGGSLYCGTCGYSQLLPAAYLGGAGTSTSNDQFKTGANYPNGGAAYFSVPNYTAYSGTDYGNALPQAPGVARNSLVGPGYRDVDMTLAKAFGLPHVPGLGEGAKLEFRLDAYNIFNNLNFNPTSISNNIANSNFGQDTAVLAGRTLTLGARFTF